VTKPERRTPSRSELAEEAFSSALALDSDWWLVRVPGRLTPLLSAEQIARAPVVVRALKSIHGRANGLGHVAYRLPAEQ
jgi:hypothetical protein